MGTVHQFPVPCNQPAAEPAQELARALRVAIDAEVGAAAPFATREVAALALTNEATRLFLEAICWRSPTVTGSRWRWTVGSTNSTPLAPCGTTPSAGPLTSNYRKFNNSYPGTLRPESGIVGQAR